MLKKTHLAIGLALGLYFLPFVNHKLLFIPITLLASLFPDIDCATSTLGKRKIFRPIQMIFQHRGALHSYTFCVLFSLLFAFFYPVFALPFFLGYSFHLLADSFTVNGLRPLWPLKVVSRGFTKTGGAADRSMFWIFSIVSAFLFVRLFI
ncbi:MAG: metal-dependent hydrolase [Nanoarchaeota archaeon]